MKITKRDIKMFLLGILSLYLIEFIFDWNNERTDFVKGFDDGFHSVSK